MSRYIYQYMNGGSTTGKSTSDWRLKIVSLPDKAKSLSEGEVVYVSPVCETKEECEQYKEEFNKNAGV